MVSDRASFQLLIFQGDHRLSIDEPGPGGGIEDPRRRLLLLQFNPLGGATTRRRLRQPEGEQARGEIMMIRYGDCWIATESAWE
jgi:hypothetical protein